MAIREARIGTTLRVAFTWKFNEESNAITAGSLYVYDSAGSAISGSPFAATVTVVTANVEYRVYYPLATAGLSAGDYTGRMVYTATQAIDDDEVAFTLLPVTSKYDRWINRVRRLLQQSGLSESQASLSYRDLMDAVNTAAEAYSRARPRVIEWEQALTASDWTYSLPAGWLPGVSQVLTAEYPVDATLQGRTYLLPRDVVIEEADSILYLVNHSPSAGETARFLYLGGYTLSHTEDNLPAAHFEAIAHAAAGAAAEMLGAGTAGTEAPELVAGAVNYRDVTSRYQATADRLWKKARLLWADRRVYV